MSRRFMSPSPRSSRPDRAPERDAATAHHLGLVALARLLARTAAGDAHAGPDASAEAAPALPLKETPHDQD